MPRRSAAETITLLKSTIKDLQSVRKTLEERDLRKTKEIEYLRNECLNSEQHLRDVKDFEEVRYILEQRDLRKTQEIALLTQENARLTKKNESLNKKLSTRK